MIYFYRHHILNTKYKNNENQISKKNLGSQVSWNNTLRFSFEELLLVQLAQ